MPNAVSEPIAHVLLPVTSMPLSNVLFPLSVIVPLVSAWSVMKPLPLMLPSKIDVRAGRAGDAEREGEVDVSVHVKRLPAGHAKAREQHLIADEIRCADVEIAIEARIACAGVKDATARRCAWREHDR